jgi:hypothetical protein
LASQFWPHDSQLILVGTVHGDPKGYEWAWELLNHLRPEVITVEISRFSVRYRERHERRWQQRFEEALSELPLGAAEHLALRRVAARIALPFEYRVARDWSSRQGVPWHPLDISGPARQHLPRYSGELLSAANLQMLLDTPDGSLEDFVADEFRRARRAQRRPLSRLPTARRAESRQRERMLAARLRQLAAGGKRLVHLGGWEHLVTWEDGGGLGQWLKDLTPHSVLLDESDRLFYHKAMCFFSLPEQIWWQRP